MNEAIQMGLFLDKSTSIEMWKDNSLWGWTCCQQRWDYCSFPSREEPPRSRASCRWRGFSIWKWNGRQRLFPWHVGKILSIHLSWAIRLRHFGGLDLYTSTVSWYNVARTSRSPHTQNHAGVVFLLCLPWDVVPFWWRSSYCESVIRSVTYLNGVAG